MVGEPTYWSVPNPTFNAYRLVKVDSLSSQLPHTERCRRDERNLRLMFASTKHLTPGPLDGCPCVDNPLIAIPEFDEYGPHRVRRTPLTRPLSLSGLSFQSSFVLCLSAASFDHIIASILMLPSIGTGSHRQRSRRRVSNFSHIILPVPFSLPHRWHLSTRRSWFRGCLTWFVRSPPVSVSILQ